MTIRRLAALACAAALLAAPAPALGQSAGDEQYQDPFAAQPEDQGRDPGSREPPPKQAPRARERPAQAAPPPERELPRTGAPTGLLAAAGAVLLLAGLGLRRLAA